MSESLCNLVKEKGEIFGLCRQEHAAEDCIGFDSEGIHSRPWQIHYGLHKRRVAALQPGDDMREGCYPATKLEWLK